MRIITEAELANNEWVRIGNKILDISDFKDMHPGGEKVLSRYAGKDATDVFFGLCLLLSPFSLSVSMLALESLQQCTKHNTLFP